MKKQFELYDSTAKYLVIYIITLILSHSNWDTSYNLRKGIPYLPYRVSPVSLKNPPEGSEPEGGL